MRENRIKYIGFALIAAGILLASSAFAPAADQLFRHAVPNCTGATPQEVFQERGLTKVGFLLISADEAQLHTAANSVRALKVKVAGESLARASALRAVRSAEDAFIKIEADLTSMEQVMNSLKGNPAEYNRRVEPYNATLKLAKQRGVALEDLKKKQGKIENSQSAYTEAVIDSAQKADAAVAMYAELANDPATTAALAAYNKTAPQAIKLGPSGNCLADIAYLKKCLSDMAADGVPVQISGSVPIVEVIINGKKHDMLWDSGAAAVLLSAETAVELGIHATEHDQTIKTELADGRTVDCKLVVIPLVRVGPFTAENVECLISPPGKVRGADLLGGAFQRHFQCRLDQAAGVLHLTPIARPAPQPVAVKSPGATGDDIFKDKGLIKTGTVLISSQEADIHSAVVSLRGLKSKVATESAGRTNISRAVQNAADLADKLETDLQATAKQLEKTKKNTIEYDKLVDSYNAGYKQYEQRKAALDELRKKMGRMQDSQSQYIEMAVTSAKKIDAAVAGYAALAKDATIKSLIENYNKTAAQPVALGPSTNFANDSEFLKTTLNEITAEGIPFHIDGGVPMVEVTINGKNLPMIWDSGASYVSLSAETAAELGLHTSPSDKSITTVVADGRKVESKLIIVPLIRVGGFTAENVECIIDPPAKERSPDLLGGSFQGRFLCRLDQQAGVIHLTANQKPK